MSAYNPEAYGGPHLHVEEPAQRTYDRFVFLSNPISKRACTADLYYQRLARMAKANEIEIIREDTSPEPHVMDEYVKELDPKADLLLLAGGDGTAHDGLNAILRTGHIGAVQIVPCGNANDLAHQLYDRYYRKKPEVVAQKQEKSTIYPLTITVDSVKFQATYHAFAYASWGISARAASVFNSSSYRSSWLHKVPVVGSKMKEGATSARALASGKPFAYKPLDSLEARTHNAHEIIATNGDHMAKYLRFHSELFRQNVQLVEAQSRADALRLIPRLISNRSDLATLHEDEVTFKILAPDEAPNYWQIDGEDHLFHGASTVTIKPALQGVNVLTARSGRLKGQQGS